MLATRFMHRLCVDVLCSNAPTAAVAPLCAASTLVVVGLAATENTPTFTEFWATLDVPPDEHTLLAELAALDTVLCEEHEAVELHTALALYCAGDVKVPYQTLCASKLGAHIAPLADARVINAFIERETKGLLVDVVKSDPEPPMTAVGVVLFVGKWTTEFDPALTKDEPFFSKLGDLPVFTSCRMMSSRRTVAHACIQGMHVVELPYGVCERKYDETNPFVAYFFLPPSDANFNDVLKKYLGSSIIFACVTHHLSFKEIDLKLPELDITCTTGLNAFLSSTMPTAFSGSASFERLSDTPGVYLQDVTHAVKIKVDAKGTTAAAATVARFATRGPGPPPPPSVVFNRPFFFAVVHKPSDTIIFASAVRDLQPQNPDN